MDTKREKVNEFLTLMNTAFPIIKNCSCVNEVDLTSNNKFLKKIKYLMLDVLSDENLNIKYLDLNKNIQSSSFKKKFVIDQWISWQLPIELRRVYPAIIDILQDSIIIDFIDEYDDKWLDIGFPLYSICDDKYSDNYIFNKYSLQLEELSNIACDFVDYISLLVGKYIFVFTRNLDDNSKTQILGNIGGLDDIRRAAKIVFVGELTSTIRFYTWYNKFLKEYRQIIPLNKKEFNQKLSINNEWITPIIK